MLLVLDRQGRVRRTISSLGSLLTATAFKPSPMKRPTVTDAADKKYNTASTFVDVGSVPDYSCTFPFRVPEGTRLKALQLESSSLDLSSLDK